MADTIAERSNIFMTLAGGFNQSIPANRLIGYKNQHNPTANPRYWAIVDFNQPSTQKRFYLFDTKSETVTQHYVAHGKGSDVDRNGIAESFSNIRGSNQSSLGIYRCDKPYQGNHGLSMLLDGLEATNSKARERSIVFHRAVYVSDEYIRQNGRIGRSEGCFVVENAVCETLISQLENGSYLIAWKN